MPDITITQKKSGEVSDQAKKEPWFHSLLYIYDPVEKADGSAYTAFGEFYNGLMGNGLGKSHQWVCWKLPALFTPRFYTFDLDPGLIDSKTDDELPGRDWEKFGQPIKEGECGKGYFNNSCIESDGMKIAYCLTAKLFLFPWFHIGAILYRYGYIFFGIIGKPIEMILKVIGNLPIISWITWSINGGPFTYKYKDRKGVEHYLPELPAGATGIGPGELIPALFGAVLPIHLLNEDWGPKYGTGGLGVIIIAIMAISALIIFVGGSSVTVAVICFFMYCVKLIKALGDFSSDKSSTTSTPAPTPAPASTKK
jgi:hypothetical protein